MVRIKGERILELHQQKFIRKILLTFDADMPKSKRNGEEFTLMHCTPAMHPQLFDVYLPKSKRNGEEFTLMHCTPTMHLQLFDV